MDALSKSVWDHYEAVEVIDRTTALRTTLARDPNHALFVVYEAEFDEAISTSLRSRIRFELQHFASLETPYLIAPAAIYQPASGCAVVFPYHNESQLVRRIVRESRLGVAESLAVARDILMALKEVHAARLVCRYIRPHDVYFSTDEASCGQARMAGCWPLMLATSVQSDQVPPDMLFYAAPETLGAIEHDVGPSADFFSLGLLLFECLTGRRPFEASSGRQLLFDHVTSAVPEVTSLVPDVPRPVSELVQRLLQKHPRDRYQSADGVLHDVCTLLERYQHCPDAESPADDDDFVLGTHDLRATITEPAYVGRDRDIALLQAELQSAAAGQASAVLLTATSGTGKTRLLSEIDACAQKDGFLVLRAQGQNQLGLGPLSTLQPVFTTCLEKIRTCSDLRHRLRAALSSYVSELLLAVPDLAQALSLKDESSAPRELSDRRIAAALAALLGNLADEQHPLLLIVDDAQWADELTLNVLECWELVQPESTLLVVATRPADSITHRLRQAIRFQHELTLKALSRQHSDQLLQSMAGSLPDEILDAVWKMAYGNPFLTAAVLRGLIESEVLVPDQGNWLLNSEELQNLQLSGEAAGVLQQRLSRLPEHSQRLLAVGAMLGKEFSLETAAILSRMSIDAALEALLEPRANHLLWEPDAQGQCRFAHDQIRDAILATLPDEKKKEIHLRAGQYLEHSCPDSHFEIAHHFNAAGQPARALPSAMLAAESARRGHALEIAEDLYRIALACFKALGLKPELKALYGLGDTLMLRGRYAEAETLLRAALRAADSATAEAEISLKLGELAFKKDEKDEAVRLWEAALRKLGGVLPSPWLMPFCLLREIGVQVLHTFLPRWFVSNRVKPAAYHDRLMCRLYSRLAYGYWYLKGKVPLLYVHLRGLNLAETWAPTPELAQAYSEHAPAMSIIPLRKRSIAYGRKSLEIRTQLKDVWGQGQSLHFLAIALYSAGRFSECVDVGRRSVRILERAGDVWEKHIAQYQIAASLYRMGRMTDAVRLAREAYDSGLAYGDEQVCANIIDIWSRATNGDLPAEVLEREYQRPRADIQAIAHVRLAAGVHLINEKRFCEAVDTLADGIRMVQAAGISNCYTSPLYAWKATALRLHLEEDSPFLRKVRRHALARHRRAAWTAVLMASRFRADLPHALRELAWAFIFRNRVRRAMILLRASIRIAQVQGARYESIQSEVVLQQVRHGLGHAGASDGLRAAQCSLAAFQTEELPRRLPVSLSLADRFDSLLDSGRRIASAVEPDEIIRNAIHACQYLLRSDDCRFVQFDDRGHPQELNDIVADLAAQCYSAGRPVVSEMPTRQFRSAIACPVIVRGRTAYSLVAANSEVRDLFGEPEERIISYIATICGAALENADGFQKLRDLNENLEQIVSERTAAVEARSAELQRTADHLRQTQVDLARARDAAEVANQAKTEFLAHMSHEIRTPISAVLGFTELLLNGTHPLHPEQRTHLLRVHSNGTHLLQLLNDLLDLSKIEAGELTVERIECQPYALLTDALESLRSPAAEKEVKLSLQVINGIPKQIITDPTRLRQIVTNLVGNAIKFSENGAVTVLVETLVDDGLLALHVQDTGVGIAAEAHEQIFEPFRQADDSVNRRFGGTGLGLPISRRLARALGGDITLISEPGKGSTFTVTVATGNLHEEPLLSENEARQLTPDTGNRPLKLVDLRGSRILVADDTSANREFIRHTLQLAGAEVDTVEHGAAAINAWQNQEYSLVIIDMRMPVMDGETAVRKLRALGADIPIVALTANGSSEDERSCRNAGCSGFLVKPISMGDLLAGVAEQLGRSTDEDERADEWSSSVPAHDIEESAFDEPPETTATRDFERLIPTTDEESSPVRTAVVPEDPFFREVAADLTDKLATTLPETRDALQRQDLQKIAEQAHWMKGTGGTVGLPDVTTLGRQLEQAAKDEDYSSADALMRRLEDLIAELQAALQA